MFFRRGFEEISVETVFGRFLASAEDAGVPCSDATSIFAAALAGDACWVPSWSRRPATSSFRNSDGRQARWLTWRASSLRDRDSVVFRTHTGHGIEPARDLIGKFFILLWIYQDSNLRPRDY